MTIEMTRTGDFSLLSVSGADARRFLQGQVSCDIEELDEQHSLSGALCNLKGRVIADFLAIAIEDGVLLRCEPQMAELLHQRLERYAVFFKADLRVVTSDWQRAGLLGEEVCAALADQWSMPLPEQPLGTLRHEDLIAVRLPDPRPRLEVLAPATATLPASTLAGTPEDWHNEDILAGIVHINHQRSERYTPQVLNYDSDGTVNFRKGCYTGQEIVARMHYRGKADRRLYRLTTDAGLPSGEETGWNVVSRQDDNRARGEVVVSAAGAQAHSVLAILPSRLADAAPDTLEIHADATTLPVTGIYSLV